MPSADSEFERAVAWWKSRASGLDAEYDDVVDIDGDNNTVRIVIDGDTGAARALKCMELTTGEVKWSVDGLGSGSLIAAGRRLIILSEDGELGVARAGPSAFEELARCRVLEGRCWTMPVLANGRIFCRSAAGDVVCVNVREGN